jgi:hypothetical protein
MWHSTDASLAACAIWCIPGQTWRSPSGSDSIPGTTNGGAPASHQANTALHRMHSRLWHIVHTVSQHSALHWLLRQWPTGDIDKRKSTSDMLFFFHNCLMSWQSLKHRVVALSRCEAEYIIVTSVATQAHYQKNSYKMRPISSGSS